ncbi:neurofilament medium polypeptide-like [Astyanax mexicanus]|uniref:Neurofilament medium polypeptide-like n=1 Tax=Astyanax mexicanus TaxID=7994 RepID=A0A8T2LRR8_ASTMX|nr:neurofilament medium polypeptide-like [Astyanax mexicanus]
MQPKELQLSHQCPERRPAAFQKWYIKGADAEHGAARCGNTLPGYWAQALPRTGLHVPGKTKNLSPTKKAAVHRYMCHSEAVASKFYVPLSTEEGPDEEEEEDVQEEE